MNGDIPGLLVSGEKFTPNSRWIADLFSLVHVTVVIDHDITDLDGLPSGFPADYIRSGTVLAKVTSSGEYREYDDANSPAGLGVAKGVLLHGFRLNAPPAYSAALPADQTIFAEMVVGGLLDSRYLIGIDANGLVDLKTAGIKFVDSI